MAGGKYKDHQSILAKFWVTFKTMALTPPYPREGFYRLFFKEDKRLYIINHLGEETLVMINGTCIVKAEWSGNDLVFTRDDDATITLTGAKTDLKGDQGDNGLAVELQVSATHIQWRYTGGAWSDLVALSALKGDQGDKGDTGSVVAAVAWDGNDMRFTRDDAISFLLVGAKLDLKGDQGDQGVKGDTGAKIISVEWDGNNMKFTLDDSTTASLANAKIDLKGDTGEKGDTGDTGAKGDTGDMEDIPSLPDETTPLDADSFPFYKVVGTLIKRVTWANIKATLKAYFDGLYNLYSHPNHSGDVTSAGDGAQTIAAGAVTLAKMANLAQNRMIGRVTASEGAPEALTPANIRTIAEINDVDTERGKRLWRLVPAANYTARPPSTSTITMVSDMTASIKVGMSLRYTWNGTEYFGQVSAIASNLLTVRGAPLSTSYDVSNLQFGGGVVMELVLPVGGLYEDADNTALLTSDAKAPIVWLKEAGYVVHYRMWSRLHDTHATHGKASIRVNNVEVNSSADGLEIAADATWYSTVVDIAAAAYDIQPGESLEVTAKKGGNGNAEDLCALVVIIIP